MFQDGKVVFICRGLSFVRVSPNCFFKNPSSFNYQTPDDSVHSLKNDGQTSKTPCQSEANVKSQSAVPETLSPTISNDSRGWQQAVLHIGIPILGTLIWVRPNLILTTFETIIRCNSIFWSNQHHNANIIMRK